MSIVKPKVFWPIVIPGTTYEINFWETTAGNLTASIPADTYYSAEELRAEVQIAMRAAHANVAALTVSVSANGIFSFANATNIKFRWLSVPSLMSFLLGFEFADTAAGLTQTADQQHKNGWYSPVAVAVDSLPIRDRKADTVTRTLEGQTKFLSENELTTRFVTFRWLPPEYTYIAFDATVAQVNRALEYWWLYGRSQFRYWPDAATEATYFDYVLDAESIAEFKPKRQFIQKGLYEVEFGFFGFVE